MQWRLRFYLFSISFSYYISAPVWMGVGGWVGWEERGSWLLVRAPVHVNSDVDINYFVKFAESAPAMKRVIWNFYLTMRISFIQNETRFVNTSKYWVDCLQMCFFFSCSFLHFDWAHISMDWNIQDPHSVEQKYECFVVLCNSSRISFFFLSFLIRKRMVFVCVP